MCKLATLKKAVLIVLMFSYGYLLSQKDTLPYNRKQEIVYDGKRYVKYNNYLTFGFGKAFAKIRTTDQNLLGVDYQFHLNREYFQLGFFMSGDQLLSNNNVQGHFCYGKRIERNKYNFAAFIGPSFSSFYLVKTDTSGVKYAENHTAPGLYICIQTVYKVKYDVGIGAELFTDLSALQKLFGCKLIVYFSGAYRGEKKQFRLKTN